MNTTSVSFISQLSPGQSLAIGDVLRFSQDGNLEVIANLCSGVVRTPPGQVPLHLAHTFEVSQADISTFLCKVEDFDSPNAGDAGSFTVELKQLLPMGAFASFVKEHATELFVGLSLSADSRVIIITSYEKCAGAYVNLSGFTLQRKPVASA